MKGFPEITKNPEKAKDNNDIESFLKNMTREDLEKIDYALNFIGYSLDEFEEKTEKIENKEEIITVLGEIAAGNLRQMRPIYDTAKNKLKPLLSVENSMKKTVSSPEKKVDSPEIKKTIELPSDIKEQIEEMNQDKEGDKEMKNYINSLNNEQKIANNQALNFIGVSSPSFSKPF